MCDACLYSLLFIAHIWGAIVELLVALFCRDVKVKVSERTMHVTQMILCLPNIYIPIP